MSINKAFLSGNITRDPDIQATRNGSTVLTFGIAVNERQKNADTGEWENYPNFFDCVVFGAKADSLKPYLEKGSRVCLMGHLKQSRWEKDGVKRSKVELIVDEVQTFFDKNASGNADSSSPNDVLNSPVYSEDVPF